MKSENIFAVIMAGGIGSRFWPMSKTACPKQFIDILGTGETLLQTTFRRFSSICPSKNILIVTNDMYSDLVKSQLPECLDENILCEPMRKNTAPCIAYANHKISKRNKDAVIVVAPSDHLILNEQEFNNMIELAMRTALEQSSLVTLGIKPSRPDTGYGYIQFGRSLKGKKLVHNVKTFTEKPDLELAQQFIDSGDFYWNSGIFIWTLQAIDQEFDKQLSDINEAFLEIQDQLDTTDEAEAIRKVYETCPNVSVDFGIMEHAEKVHVVLSDFGWSDLGTWGSLYTHLGKDENGNAIVGGKLKSYQSSNNVVHVPENKLVVIEGLDDYIVVESDGALLICRKSEEQKIRQMVNDIKRGLGEKYV